MELLNYLPMIAFSLLGQMGPPLMGSAWVTGYFVGTIISAAVVLFFVVKGVKQRGFLLASLIYLALGSLFIILDFAPGYKLFEDVTAAAFFAFFFLVHLSQYLFPRFFNRFLAPLPHSAKIALGLYLALVIVTFFLSSYSIWISVFVFIVVRTIVASLKEPS